MKKIILLVLVFVFVLLSVCFVFNRVGYISNCINEAKQYENAAEMISVFWKKTFPADVFGIVSSIPLIIICLIFSIKEIRTSNTDHAIRLTYEEYKEKVKQKKIEKTKKKMRDLQEKLQKESTE